MMIVNINDFNIERTIYIWCFYYLNSYGSHHRAYTCDDGRNDNYWHYLCPQTNWKKKTQAFESGIHIYVDNGSKIIETIGIIDVTDNDEDQMVKGAQSLIRIKVEQRK